MSTSLEEAITTIITKSQEPLEAITKISQGTRITNYKAVDYLRKFFKQVIKLARRRRKFKVTTSLIPILNNTIRQNSQLAIIKRGLKCRVTIRSIQYANKNIE